MENIQNQSSTFSTPQYKQFSIEYTVQLQKEWDASLNHKRIHQTQQLKRILHEENISL